MWRLKNLGGKRPAQKSKDELYDYWKNPDDGKNNPAGYFNATERSKFLLSLVKPRLDTGASIIELGCNVGRNLNYLWQAGYRNLTGIEINAKAIELMQQGYPDMKPTIYQGAIEDRIKELGQYDLVFAMAVLEHIHSDSEWIFPEIARMTGKFLITIENEKETSERHFPRNYKKIFEGLGLRQVYERQMTKQEQLFKDFYARVFITDK